MEGELKSRLARSRQIKISGLPVDQVRQLGNAPPVGAFRELVPQALVVFLGSGEPYSVIRSVRRLVPQDQHDFVFYIDCKAAKHRTRVRR